MHDRLIAGTLAPILLLFLPECVMTQDRPPEASLTVDGLPGSATLMHMGGKSYVDVQSLARLTGGSLKFQGDRVILTLPAEAGAQANKKGLSREFIRADIEAMAVIREWRTAVISAVGNNFPVTEAWIGSYRRTAQSKLALVSAAAATDADRAYAGLVNNEFGFVQQFTGKYTELHQNLTYISPDAAQNDPLNQKVLSCAQSLEALSPGSPFEDIPVCH